MYQDVLYGYPNLTDDGLSAYYKDASFGVRPEDIESTTVPAGAPAPVTIYRDKQFGVPHIYGDTVESMAYGAGYVAAQDRLFMIDVLRHYGRGHLSELIGPSCGNMAMDHDQLQLTGYTQADKDAQLAYIDTLGPLGHEGRQMIHSFVQGINRYITEAETSPTMMPVEYPAATGGLPETWQDSDIIDIASLVGGIFGKGGGNEVGGGKLLTFLQQKFGAVPGMHMFQDFHEVNDPGAPVVVEDQAFPYELQGPYNPTKNVLVDPLATTTDPSTNEVHPDCEGYESFLQDFHLPSLISNALLVDAKHSASGRPIAVFGPQVGYFAPQILMEVDLHAPDYDARGASFPGTNFLVELGHGRDYAWSATSAGSDIVDQRLVETCATPEADTDPDARYYLLNGACVKMRYHDDAETAVTKPGGTGVIITIHHKIYSTAANDPVQGNVLGFTTTLPAPQQELGKQVAIVTQRSTWQHELDSAEGFLHWQHPSLTYDARSWMEGADKIGYTFNWFYADDRDIAYKLSGHDPVRPADLDATLPTWGGHADTDWQGFLADDAHPSAINPPTGYLSSWNNKPAPMFAASDASWDYGPVFRQQTLVDNIKTQFALHNNQITRANLVQAMEDGASVDLTGTRTGAELMQYLDTTGVSLSADEQLMIGVLRTWIANGAHRRRAQHGDAEYADAAGVAIMDELNPHLIEALFDPVLLDAPNGATVNTRDGLASGYSKHPMGFTDLPSGGVGSSYDGGWEGYMLKLLRQLRGAPVAQPYSATMLAKICGPGCAADCPAAIKTAITDTFNALAAVNGSSTPGSWTSSTANDSAGKPMPAYDAIHLSAVGLVTHDDFDWQNRPTFQQVVDYPSHRDRAGTVVTPVIPAAGLPNTLAATPASQLAAATLLGLALAAFGIGARARRRRKPLP
jgi:acyl-homoserine lactone acylase PvdQ